MHFDIYFFLLRLNFHACIENHFCVKLPALCSSATRYSLWSVVSIAAETENERTVREFAHLLDASEAYTLAVRILFNPLKNNKILLR